MGLWKGKYLATKSFLLGVLWKQKWTFWVLSCIFPPILRCRHIFVHLLVWGEWVTPYCLHCLPSPAWWSSAVGPDPAYRATEGGKATGTTVPFLKSPTKTSQDKAETSNTANHTGTLQGGSTSHRRSSNMIQGGSDHQELQLPVHSLEKAHMGCL